MHVACVLVDHFPFRLEAARNPKLAKSRAIVYRRSGSLKEVVDSSPAVPGVLPGTPLHEAQSHCKDAILVEADSVRYQRVHEHILGRLEEWSPMVERSILGCAYVGLDGLETTYGTEDRLIDALLSSVPRVLEPRLGISIGKFPAYAAALKATPGRAFKPPVPAKEFLSPLSVDYLPVPREIPIRLHSFGLNTIGDLAAFPLGPLQAQFGSVGAKIWRLAQGIDDTPLAPLKPMEEVTESLQFAIPTPAQGQILIAVESLLKRLLGRPDMRGRYARVCTLVGHIPNKPTWTKSIHFRPPLGDPKRGYFVIRSVLESVPLSGPLEDISLTLGELTGESGKQGSLLADVRQRELIREAVAQLKVAQGHNPIYQVREVEPWSRIPERRAVLIPYEP